MPTVSPCPELDALHRLALNQSDPAEALQVHRHLVHCVPCAQMVRSLKDAVQVLAESPSGRPPALSAAPERSTARALDAPHTGPVSRVSPTKEAPLFAGVPAREYAFLSAPERPDELGQLGPYRILKKLGHGGMGIVFAAEDMNLQRKVALKVMLPEPAQDPTGRERFLQEARAAAAINHDHIVTIYQVGEANGIPYLAMHLLHGEPLSAALRRELKLPLSEALRIGREIAEGLAAAHSQGLIHRDIKPANIWLETGKRRVKILDFGLARSTSDNAKRLTQTGMVVGTAGYMSPEQARGQPADGRSDLFSLGCVLYEMTTAREPFAGPDPMARLTALAVQDPVPPHELNKALPPHFSELVLWLLAKDPKDRPRTAQAVADALGAIAQQRGGNSSQRHRDLRPQDVANLWRRGRDARDVQERQTGAFSGRQWLVLLLVLGGLVLGGFLLGKVVLKLIN